MGWLVFSSKLRLGQKRGTKRPKVECPPYDDTLLLTCTYKNGRMIIDPKMERGNEKNKIKDNYGLNYFATVIST